MLRLCGLTALFSRAGVGQEASRSDSEDASSDLVTEDQKGDPTDANEYVTFSPTAIRRIVNKSGKASFEKWEASLTLAMISTARQFIGKSRHADPSQIAEFLGLFNLPL